MADADKDRVQNMQDVDRLAELLSITRYETNNDYYYYLAVDAHMTAMSFPNDKCLYLALCLKHWS